MENTLSMDLDFIFAVARYPSLYDPADHNFDNAHINAIRIGKVVDELRLLRIRSNFEEVTHAWVQSKWAGLVCFWRWMQSQYQKDGPSALVSMSTRHLVILRELDFLSHCYTGYIILEGIIEEELDSRSA
ncbi:hypothetical protein QAD02_006176 [Eretmocerus hayati]|uniref:Uncharacterized protein n=1 Tax=Eretmocerus hayati TaxID=131215 RepID=A0ACC2N0G7_9HYME|nr:hypothetical protein QAD02_006176 [Eretmocerus hayati]